MLGLKGTENYKADGKEYEVGKEYKLKGDPYFGNFGFEFNKTIDGIDDKFPLIYTSTKVLEIDAVGAINGYENKLCTNEIKIIREVPRTEFIKYNNENIAFDENGDMLFVKNHRIKVSYKYKDGKVIREIINDSFWVDFVYDGDDIVERLYCDGSKYKCTGKELRKGLI